MAHVFAVGNLVIDHLFSDRGSGPVYIGSAGGGAVFNAAANAAKAGGPVWCGGVYGDDFAGQLAVDELVSMHVEVSGLHKLLGQRTEAVFEVWRGERDTLFGRESNSDLGLACVVCGSREFRDSATNLRVEDSALAEHAIATEAGSGVLCVDRLSADRLHMARVAGDMGAFSALDLGRRGFARALPASELVSALSEFDLVMLPGKVARSITQRLTLDSEERLAAIGPRRALIVTRDSIGGTVYERGAPAVHWEGPETSALVHDVGAGDALFGHLVVRLADGWDQPLADVLPDAIRQAGASINSLGARGHLGLTPRPPAWLAPFAGSLASDIRAETSRQGRCPFCGTRQTESLQLEGRSTRQPMSSQRKTGTAAQNTRGYLRRRMFHAIERPDAVEQCATLLKSSGTAILVGSGGSYSAAVFASLVFERHSNVFARVARPLEYVRSRQQSKHLVVFSYSGSTPDCHSAIDHARALDVEHIHLVTAASAPALASELRLELGNDQVIAYAHPTGNERGFLSIAGTVSPSALFAAAAVGAETLSYFGGDRFTELTKKAEEAAEVIAPALADGRTIHVFGTGLAWPAVIDIESKFVEGALGPVQLHESKDFSHGRFMSVLGARPEMPPVTVVLTLGSSDRYEATLVSALAEETSSMHFRAERADALGALELLIAVQLLAQACGARLGKDISKPDSIPPGGLSLYRWPHGLDG